MSRAAGAAELLGALGLLLPTTLGASWGWPKLQRHAGMALAAMFCVLVVANINLPPREIAGHAEEDEGIGEGMTGHARRPRNRRARPGAPLATRQPINPELTPMNMSISIAPLLALIAGILILVVPRLLNYIVALYLIVIGVIGLFGGIPGISIK